MIETGCTIEHDGRTFTAGGAVITDTYARVYVGRCLNSWPGPTPAELPMWRAGYSVRPAGVYGTRYAATDWHGNVIGELREMSSWRIPNGWTSGRVYAYRLTLPDGRTYAVRGSGEGMSAGGRRMGRNSSW